MFKCPECGKERQNTLFRIFEIESGIYETKCIVCHWDFADTEMAEKMAEGMVETEKVFFEAADKIWERIMR